MDRTQKVELTNLCMVADAQGRLLVEDRLDPVWGGLCFPGGHVEKGESFRDAVIREVREETGLTIENPRLCGIKQFDNGESGRYVVLLYRADRFSGALRDSEEGPVFWIDRAEIPGRRTVPALHSPLSSHHMGSKGEIFFILVDRESERGLQTQRRSLGESPPSPGFPALHC